MHLVKALNLLTITNRLLNVSGASPFTIHSNNSYKIHHFWIILIQFFSKFIRSNVLGYSHNSCTSHPLIKICVALGSGLNASEIYLVILFFQDNFCHFYLIKKTPCFRQVGSSPALYSWVPEFEPWLGDQIRWHVSRGVFESLQHISFYYHKLEHVTTSRSLAIYFLPIILSLDDER